MKKLFLSLLLIGAWLVKDAPGAFAQTPFAPVGAEWYHDMAYGVFHSVVTGDTVINGISCRHIAVLPMVKNSLQAPPVGNLSTYNFYVYDNTDTVFIYNDLFEVYAALCFQCSGR